MGIGFFFFHAECGAFQLDNAMGLPTVEMAILPLLATMAEPMMTTASFDKFDNI